MSKRPLLVLIGLSLLSGCGFKLRGSYQLSTALSQLSIEGGKRELVERLTGILMDNGITVTDAGADSPTLILSRSEFTRKAVGTDADGIATEYEYTYYVESYCPCPRYPGSKPSITISATNSRSKKKRIS